MKKKIAFHTLGCKLNFAETSTLARAFREGEYEIVGFKEAADIYVINTCSVTGTAEKKCKHAIRQAHQRNPDASIAVVGCFSQLRPDELATFEGVDIILGSNDKFLLPGILSQQGSGLSWAEHHPVSKAAYQHIQASGNKPDFISSFSSGDRTRSFVKIQDGCDYFCSYCTIPYARGRSRSASIADVMAIVSSSLMKEVKEIVLTGVNIGDFGRNTGETFFQLLQELDKVSRIPRIRISSIEPDLLTDEIIELVASSSRIMPHFHIPLQSGSQKILSLMRRKYTPGLFSGRVEKIKVLIPHACIAADVITAFPGETEEDFNDTCSLIESIPVSYVHVFSYSSRPGTLSSKIAEKVAPEVIRERSTRLQGLSDRKKAVFYDSCLGREVKVLFESDNHQGYMHGFTENYLHVKTLYDPALVNTVVEMKLGEKSGEHCYLYTP